MSELIARLFFAAWPAFLIGGILAMFSPPIGIGAGIALLGLGWDVTRARPERGES